MQSIARVQETQETVRIQESSRKRSFLRDEFPFIERASIIFALCAVLGTILVTGSQLLLNAQLDAVEKSQSRERAVRTNFEKVANEKQVVQLFQPKYEQLMARGFIGVEKRLDWVEHIQAIQKSAGLLPISYEIAEQQPFLIDPSIHIGSLELHGSKILVKLDLLHEQDLQDFLDGIKAKHVVNVQSCSLKRLPQSQSVKITPTLSAECTLYWITLGRASSPSIN